MLLIRKGKEPRKLRDYRKKEFSSYSGCDCKPEIREALRKEQTGLCAYCMSYLPDEEPFEIEHFIAQNPEDTSMGSGERLDLSLEYKNMLGVCFGGRGSPPSYQHCGTSRENRPLTIDPLSPLKMESIHYGADGTIRSNDPECENDINRVLHLNQDGLFLKRNRKEVLDSLRRYLRQEQPDGVWKADVLVRARKRFAEPNDLGRLPQYAGVAVDYLEKKLVKDRTA
jgi:uncharacterized protein (TIGR02646 family)